MSIRRVLTKFLWRVHRWGYRVSGGRLGGHIVGMPVLLLTTTGRRSGRPHTTALTYRREEKNLVIVASNGGARQHPAWYLNLNALPRAEVQIGRGRLFVRSREAIGPEYDRLWTRTVQAYRGYGVYQTRTARRIPVIILEPVEK
jgi:deazaflavin-dependent oxidoreductase (nitroreductase family)